MEMNSNNNNNNNNEDDGKIKFNADAPCFTPNNDGGGEQQEKSKSKNKSKTSSSARSGPPFFLLSKAGDDCYPLKGKLEVDVDDPGARNEEGETVYYIGRFDEEQCKELEGKRGKELAEVVKEQQWSKNKLYVSSSEDAKNYISRNHAVIFNEMGHWKIRKGKSKKPMQALLVDGVELEGEEEAFLLDQSLIQISSNVEVSFFWPDKEGEKSKKDKEKLKKLIKEAETLYKMSQEDQMHGRASAMSIMINYLVAAVEGRRISDGLCYDDDVCKKLSMGKGATKCKYFHSCELYPGSTNKRDALGMRRMTRSEELYAWIGWCEKTLGRIRFVIEGTGKMRVVDDKGNIHALDAVLQDEVNQKDANRVKVQLGRGNKWMIESTQALCYYFVVKWVRNLLAHRKSGVEVAACEALLVLPEVEKLVKALFKLSSVCRDSQLKKLEKYWPDKK